MMDLFCPSVLCDITGYDEHVVVHFEIFSCNYYIFQKEIIQLCIQSKTMMQINGLNDKMFTNNI